ncbi:dihydrolipoyl dehydrogenase [Arenimonas sp. MALMAid1274]|uniref:dihydrolipoyl dehydrogenase n=1 Tax=Arenimonas sp. MALMAid1274 TaxID=3411630 RepID=UPI003B9E8B53
MAKTIELRVPDLGDDHDVPVIELLVAVGDNVKKDQGLVTLESDKATMEVPASAAGVITALKVKVGDTVSAGDVIALADAGEGEAAAATDGKAPATASTSAGAGPTPPAKAAEAAKPAAASAPSASSGAPANAPAPAAAAGSGRKADIECRMLVLGSGPGGYTAAFRSADLGLDTVLVERYDSLGGVCLNVGCIPSKALLHAAEVLVEAKHAADFGIEFGTPKIDLDKLRGHKDKTVAQMVRGLAGMAKQRKVRTVTGTGQFVSANEMEVRTSEGVKLVRFEQCIIAAGSQPVKLGGFPWDDARVMDSTDALLLVDIPKTLLVVGGGIIGLEMACVYSALGSEVTVVEFMDQLMPGADKDLVKPLADLLRKRGVAVHLGCKVAKVDAKKDALHASFEGDSVPEKTRYERVLVSVGRVPNGGKLEAGKAGVAVTERGFIPVDRQMRTNVPHIFAIGDLVGQPMLAHKATHEGKLAAEVAAGEKKEWVARVIPSVAYTDPEIAWVGVTETEAKAKGLAVGVAKFPWAASARAVGIGRTEGFTKLIFDEHTDRVIGAGIVGVRAGDLIAELALAIEMGCEASDIGHTIHPHPTLSESVGMAAEIQDGSITDLYIPRKK